MSAVDGFEALLGPGRGRPAIPDEHVLAGRQRALKALTDRRRYQPERVDNASLHAGEPMYYWCASCGHLADTLPEEWWETPPRELCNHCQALSDQGWLDERSDWAGGR